MKNYGHQILFKYKHFYHKSVQNKLESNFNLNILYKSKYNT